MTDPSQDHQQGVSRAYRVQREAAFLPLRAYGALSFTQKGDPAEGTLETSYRLHLMDLTTHRLVPHLLGVAGLSCDHLACEMVMLNSLAAGYMVEMGWANDHSSTLATDLLEERGFAIERH